MVYSSLLLLMESPLANNLGPDLCGVWSGSALFAYDPFTDFRVRLSLSDDRFQNRFSPSKKINYKKA